MLARLIDNHWVYLDQVTLGIEPKLIDHFSVRHPRSYFIDTSQQSWDGYYRKYDAKRKRLARPLLQELIKFCNDNDIPLEISDTRPKVNVPDPNQVGPDWLPGIILEQYQIDAIKKTTENEVGIIKSITGSGKSVMLTGIVKLFNCLTVVIAEQRIVIEQLKERLQLLDIFDVGMFYGGERPNGQKVIVGSIQSLSTPPDSLRLKNPTMYASRLKHARQFQAIVKKTDLLLVDECVHEMSRISTDKGLITAKELVERLKNNDHIQARVNNQYYPITGWSDKHDKSLIITTNTYRTLQCSRNHKIVTFVDGKRVDKYASDLKVGDLLLACNMISKLKSIEIDNLNSYSIESVRSVNEGDVCRLIDFSVDNVHLFEANGLLVHNCDKASAANYRNLFKYFYNGRRLYGFTATPFDVRKPVENLILKEHLGSVIFESDRRELEKLGRIIPIKFNMIVVGEDGSKSDKTAFDIAEREQLIDNIDFHNLISKIVNNFYDESTLILVDTCNVEDLGFALEKAIPGSKFIYGKTTKTMRRKYLKMFEAKELKCLIGGKILKRGLDVCHGMNNLILCGGGQLWSNLEQSIGRSLRLNDKGYARVFGFLFMNSYYLYKHGKEQLKAVVSMGYKSSVIFSDKIVDGEQFVKSKFRKPK